MNERTIIVAYVIVCIFSTQASQSADQDQQTNVGNPCRCSGLIKRTLDCSFRRKTSVGPNDRCFGRTKHANFAHNQLSTFPSNLSSSTTEVNVSSNLLASLPRPPQVNAAMKVLDLYDNRIDGESDELRALSSLEILDVSINRLQSLSFLPNPCNLRHLNAHHNVISNLSGPLGGCTGLERLDVSDNRLTNIPSGTLSPLKKLQRLLLARTGLVILEGDTFQGLEKLEHLDISENKLMSLPSGIFSSSTHLKTLYLDSNAITTLPSDVFRGLTELEWLSISKNKLTTLPSGIFSGLSQIKYILLAENQLRSLPEGLFSGLNTIEGVALWKNELESLPPRLFAGLISLRSVGLDHNKLSTLPANTFDGISFIDSIDLAHNRLSSLSPGLFRGISYLRNLDLSGNRFSTLTGRDLAGLGNVLLLDMSGNMLATLPHYDDNWPEITSASFFNNRIVQANEGTVRSWLGSGSTRRFVRVGGLLKEPGAMRWTLEDSSLTTTVESDCACGSVKLRKAEVAFCFDVACAAEPSRISPTSPVDWKEAARRGRLQ